MSEYLDYSRNRELADDETVEGTLFPRGPRLEFTRSGRLAFAYPPAAGVEVGGRWWRTSKNGHGVNFSPSGGIACGELAQASRQGAIDLPVGSIVRLRSDGTVESVDLEGVGEAPVLWFLARRRLEFSADGALISATLARTASHEGKRYPAGTRVSLTAQAE